MSNTSIIRIPSHFSPKIILLTSMHLCRIINWNIYRFTQRKNDFIGNVDAVVANGMCKGLRTFSQTCIFRISPFSLENISLSCQPTNIYESKQINATVKDTFEQPTCFIELKFSPFIKRSCNMINLCFFKFVECILQWTKIRESLAPVETNVNW